MKIKKRFLRIAFGLLGCGAFITACEDNFTDLDRNFILVEGDIINNVNDVNRLLAGTYNAINYTTIFSRNSLAADEALVGSGNRGQGLQEFDFQVSSGDAAPTGLWASGYNTIDNANRVIESLENITIEDDEMDLANSIRGQALAIRAFSHFDLLRAFAEDFDSSTPGVILQLRTLSFPEDSSLELPRATVGEVLQSINDDLDDAEALIPASLNSDYEVFNLNVIAALRARMALYTEQYDDAVDYATQVLGNIPLLMADDYFAMWRDNIAPGEGPSETIFQVERDITDARIGNVWQATNNDVFFAMSTDLQVRYPNGDIRREVNLDFETDVTSDVASSSEWVIGKYLGVETATRYLTHVRIFRSSEMLLIRAEANARLMNFTEAQDDIEFIREVRGDVITTPDYTAISMQDVLLDILAERRIELAFEGHRLFDLKRYGLPVQRNSADCNINCELPADSFRFTYPIPQAEIFANPGISEDNQNTGY